MWRSLTRNKIPGTPTTVIFWLALAAVLTYVSLVFAWDLRTPFPLIWFCTGLLAGVAFHEGGHALCALLASIPIRVISIGMGPLLLQGRAGETTLEWRLYPFAGYVAQFPIFADRRLATAFSVIVGVLGNVLVIAMAIGLGSAAGDSPTLRDSLVAIIVPQVWFIAWSLYPFKLARRRDNDMRLLLRLFSHAWNMPENVLEEYRRRLDRYRSGSAMPFDATPASSRISYQFLYVDRWTNKEVCCEWRDALMRELARGNLRPEEEALVLDGLLTYALVCGDSKLRPHLDEWSVRALSLAPDVATLVGTRGSVLVELGHYEAGKSLLLPLAQDDANSTSSDSKFDAFMSQLFLTRAEYALGNMDNAAAMAVATLRTAKTMPLTADMCMVLARFNRELQTHPDYRADWGQPASGPVNTAACPPG